MKKLLTSTALIGALVITSTSFAETKFGGNVENTWTNRAAKTTALKELSSEQIGTDIEITFEHTKKLSNGWDAKIAAAIDESGETTTTQDGMAVSRSYVQLNNGSGLTLQIGSEGIKGAEFYPIPTVADISTDIGAAGTTKEYSLSLNDTQALGFAYATGFVTIEALYAPDAKSPKSNGDANINARTAGSGVEAAYKFKALGGALTGHVGANKFNSENDLTSSAQESARSASVQYNFGKVQVGAGRLEAKAAALNSALVGTAQTKDREITTDSFGITLAASDVLSFGIQYKESSSDQWASDEEVTTVQAAYNFGGIGFSLNYVQNENDGGTTGTDVDVFMIRTKTSF